MRWVAFVLVLNFGVKAFGEAKSPLVCNELLAAQFVVQNVSNDSVLRPRDLPRILQKCQNDEFNPDQERAAALALVDIVARYPRSHTVMKNLDEVSNVIFGLENHEIQNAYYLAVIEVFRRNMSEMQSLDPDLQAHLIRRLTEIATEIGPAIYLPTSELAIATLSVFFQAFRVFDGDLLKSLKEDLAVVGTELLNDLPQYVDQATIDRLDQVRRFYNFRVEDIFFSDGVPVRH